MDGFCYLAQRNKYITLCIKYNEVDLQRLQQSYSHVKQHCLGANEQLARWCLLIQSEGLFAGKCQSHGRKNLLIRDYGQYKLLFTIVNNTKVCEGAAPRSKKFPRYVVEFEAGEKRIVYESL